LLKNTFNGQSGNLLLLWKLAFTLI
jgi:hypothetical protein